MIFDSNFLEIDYNKDYSIKGIDYDDNFIKMIMKTKSKGLHSTLSNALGFHFLLNSTQPTAVQQIMTKRTMIMNK